MFFVFFFWFIFFFFKGWQVVFSHTDNKKNSPPCWFETPDGESGTGGEPAMQRRADLVDLVGEWKRERKKLVCYLSGFGLQRGKIRAVFDRWDQIAFDVIFIQPAEPESFRRLWGSVRRVTARRTVHGSRRAARLSGPSYLPHRSLTSVCLVLSETGQG